MAREVCNLARASSVFGFMYGHLCFSLWLTHKHRSLTSVLLLHIQHVSARLEPTTSLTSPHCCLAPDERCGGGRHSGADLLPQLHG